MHDRELLVLLALPSRRLAFGVEIVVVPLTYLNKVWYALLSLDAHTD